MKICNVILSFVLAVAMTATMMPLAGVIAGTADDMDGIVTYAAEAANVPGGTIASNCNDQNLAEVFGDSAALSKGTGINANTRIITLNADINPVRPIRFIKGNAGDKIIIRLNGHTITGAAGTQNDKGDEQLAAGKNAVEIAADEFDVEIKGPGKVIGGKGAQCMFDYDGRIGLSGGDAVFFCERVDNLHGVTENYGDILDEGYHPDELQYGLTVSEGAELIGGEGANAAFDDWLSNVRGDSGSVGFSASAGKGGAGIGQVFTGTGADSCLEELSYAKITITDGSVTGGSGGNVDIGDHLLTTTDIQKLDAIGHFMKGKSADYDYESNVTEKISFLPGDGGNGIEFYAGRKYVAVAKDGKVYGGEGGKTISSKRAAMVKKIFTTSGDGGDGIYVCGDTGLTNAKASLSETETAPDFWGTKAQNSEDVGIYIAGLIKGGSSPRTAILHESPGFCGEGIDCNLDGRNLCETYTSEPRRVQYDSDRGIVLVDTTGKVFGGDGKTSVTGGGSGADAIRGGSTGGPASSARITAGHFVIKGEVTGGEGAHIGGNGISLTKEREYMDETLSSAYFAGCICGSGIIKGGDSGDWPYLEDYSQFAVDASGIVLDDGEPVCTTGIGKKYDYHPGSLTISPTIQEKQGNPAHVMKEDSQFSVNAVMTPFTTAPSNATKLGCTVTRPSGYEGKVFVEWHAEFDDGSGIGDIEAADGAYNNFNLLGNADYPYGWQKFSYGFDYKIAVAPYERMAEKLKYNDKSVVKVYCFARLEDGRYKKSNVIWFSKERRSSTGWSGGPGVIDDPGQEAADAVAEMLENLPKLEVVSLDDLENVEAARAAYEALTDEQKELLAPYMYLLNDLEAAEQKIEELKAAVVAVEDQIDDMISTLPVLSEIDPNDAAAIAEAKDQIAAAKDRIAAAVAAYNALADDQKDRVNTEKIAALTRFVESYNGLAEGDEDIDTLVPSSKRITADMITIAGATYTGKALTPKVTVKDGDRVLAEGTDYTKKYSNNINAGKGEVTVMGEGAYRQTVTKEFIINPKAVTPSVALSTKRYTYNAKARKPAVTVKVGTVKLAATQFTASYAAGRKNVGTYKVTVKLKGNYKGAKAANFTIAPKGAAIVKPKPAKKALTVKWKKQSAKMAKSRITGYQIQCCTSKAFKSGVKKTTVKGYGKTSAKVSKLKGKKVYYVRVRTYMKTGGKTYYSNWSKALKTKTK